MTSQDKTAEQLRACPWCNKVPLMDTNAVYVRCNTPGCPLEGFAVHIDEWSIRALNVIDMQNPIAEVDELDCETGPGAPCFIMLGPMPPIGTKLYTHPAPTKNTLSDSGEYCDHESDEKVGPFWRCKTCGEQL